MRHLLLSAFVLLFSLLLLAACSDAGSTGDVPKPVAMTEEAVGHYCSMTVLEHEGPKAQIHLAGIEQPVWFTQVRDAVAFLRSPEEQYEAVVVYVHGMDKAANWAHPGDEAWIDARQAWFVIGSGKTGGMGTPETIPFWSKMAAKEFVSLNGGGIVRLDEIPDAYIHGSTVPDEVARQTSGQ